MEVSILAVIKLLLKAWPFTSPIAIVPRIALSAVYWKENPWTQTSTFPVSYFRFQFSSLLSIYYIFTESEENRGLLKVLDSAGRIVFALPCHLCYHRGKATVDSIWMSDCFCASVNPCS